MFLCFQPGSSVWDGDTERSVDLCSWWQGQSAESPGPYPEGKPVNQPEFWVQTKFTYLTIVNHHLNSGWPVDFISITCVFVSRRFSQGACPMRRWSGLQLSVKCVWSKWPETRGTRSLGCYCGRTESVFTQSTDSHSKLWGWTWASSVTTVTLSSYSSHLHIQHTSSHLLTPPVRICWG